VNGDSKSTNKSGPSLFFAGRAGTRDFCSAFAALVGPVQNIFSSTDTISIPLSPSPSKLGRQPCWVAWLSVCISAITPSTFLHPLVSYVSISYCTPLSYSEKHNFLPVFLSFQFRCRLFRIAPFISAAIFPLICNTMIFTFGELLYTPFTAVTA
jgi:hypothetical protein